MMNRNTDSLGAEMALQGPSKAWPGWLRGVIRFSRQRPLGAVGGGVVLVMILTAIFADLLAPYNPLNTDYSSMLLPPSHQHWMGADAYGRDVLSRIIYGSRTALLVGFP